MFVKGEIVVHRYYDEKELSIKFVESTIMDPGATLTSILIFTPQYEDGCPCVRTVDNKTLIDINSHKANIRDKKIDDIIKDETRNERKEESKTTN